MKNIDEIFLGLSSITWTFVYSFFQFCHLGQLESIVPTTEGIQVGIINLVSQFGGLGLAVWLVIRHTTITIPAMQKEFREEREAIVKMHSNMTDNLVRNHNEAMQMKICRFSQQHENE